MTPDVTPAPEAEEYVLISAFIGSSGPRVEALAPAGALVPGQPVPVVLVTREIAQEIVRWIERTAEQEYAQAGRAGVMAMWVGAEIRLAYKDGDDEITHQRVQPDDGGRYDLAVSGLVWRWSPPAETADALPVVVNDDQLLTTAVSFRNGHDELVTGVVECSFLAPRLKEPRAEMLFVRDHAGRGHVVARDVVDVIHTGSAFDLADLLRRHTACGTPALDGALVDELARAVDPTLPDVPAADLVQRTRALLAGVPRKSLMHEVLRDAVGYLTTHGR